MFEETLPVKWMILSALIPYFQWKLTVNWAGNLWPSRNSSRPAKSISNRTCQRWEPEASECFSDKEQRNSRKPLPKDVYIIQWGSRTPSQLHTKDKDTGKDKFLTQHIYNALTTASPLSPSKHEIPLLSSTLPPDGMVKYNPTILHILTGDFLKEPVQPSLYSTLIWKQMHRWHPLKRKSQFFYQFLHKVHTSPSITNSWPLRTPLHVQKVACMPKSFSDFQTTLFGLMKDITSAYVLRHHGHNATAVFMYSNLTTIRRTRL